MKELFEDIPWMMESHIIGNLGESLVVFSGNVLLTSEDDEKLTVDGILTFEWLPSPFIKISQAM